MAVTGEGSEPSERSTCCIAGGGPAGLMLGFLLARSGIRVTILEKHRDFLRDFRGDTVHPSTLQILEDLGLMGEFAKLPQRRVERLGVQLGARFQPLVEFRGLRPFEYLSLVPQWDFLDMIARRGEEFPGFDLRMGHEVVGLTESRGEVSGVEVRSPDGSYAHGSDLVIACDGRNSTVRQCSGLTIRDLGAPMDVLWFRLPRAESDPEDTFGLAGSGRMMVLLNRTDYWQAAFVVPKGSDGEIRAQPIPAFRELVSGLAPFLTSAAETLSSWDDVKTLTVRVDRLETWHRPGLLLIGDAAHAMSPIGGVGINLAIQDAVAAANVLVPALTERGSVSHRDLDRIQKRRYLPTRITQAFQILIQNRVISRALASKAASPSLPFLLRFLLRFAVIRRIPARVIGYGVRQERVKTESRSTQP